MSGPRQLTPAELAALEQLAKASAPSLSPVPLWQRDPFTVGAKTTPRPQVPPSMRAPTTGERVGDAVRGMGSSVAALPPVQAVLKLLAQAGPMLDEATYGQAKPGTGWSLGMMPDVPQKSPLWLMTRREFMSQPGVVYHGGRGEYRIQTKRAGSATGNPTSEFGAFFTPEQREAQRYVSDFHGGKGHVEPAIVRLRSPYHMPFAEFDRIIGADWKQLGLESGLKEISRRVKQIKDDLIANGYDGIIVGEPGKMRSQEIIAFNDNQIVQHRYAVEEALAAGRPVPEQVLADYPDLAQRRRPQEAR